MEENAIVMLLGNFDAAEGLLIGTRSTIKRLYDNIILGSEYCYLASNKKLAMLSIAMANP